MKKDLFMKAVRFFMLISLVIYILIVQGCNSVSDKSDYSSLIKFEYVDPLEKVMAEASYFPHKEAIAEVVRGENATLQFIVRSSASIKGLKAGVSLAENGGNSLPPAKTGFVGYVKVGRTIWDYSRDRIMPESGYYPDPVLEQESIDVDFGNTQPIWVSVPIPADVKDGLYKGKITISGKAGNKNFSISKDYSIKVYPVTLEKPTLWVTNWFSMAPQQLKWLNGGKDFEPFSEEHWGLVRLIAKKMAEYRQNVAILSPLDLSEFTENNGKWTVDFTNFDKAVNIFIEEGVIGRIEGGHIGGRESTWTSQFVVMVPGTGGESKEKFMNMPMSDPRAKNFYSQFFVALDAHLKEKGWKDMYMQHIADEPIEENIKTYTEIAGFVKKIVPDFRIIEACHSKNLGNLLDIWVPQLNFMDEDYEFYSKQNDVKGKEAWFYTCLNPKGEYANRFIELPLIKTRYVHWLNYKYNIPGYLHWGLNYWNDTDPFGEQTSIQYEGGNILPGGDGWIVYPKDGKLLSSIRYDAMRDGIVDYELFRMLERKDSVQARDIVNKVVYAFDKYDNNIEAFRNHRRRMMELLSL